MTVCAINSPAEQTRIEELWRAHYPSVVSAAQRLVRRRDLAEELAQQAFLNFMERSCTPDPGKEVAFLRRMAVNLAITHLRRTKCEDRHLWEEAPMVSSAEDEALRREQSEKMRRCLAMLSPQQRSVIVSQHIGGLSGGETAASLGISTGSVKTHSSRARSALRRSFEEVAGSMPATRTPIAALI